MPEEIKAVEMVRSIREAHYEKIKDLSPEDKIAFFREKARALHAELGRPDEVEPSSCTPNAERKVENRAERPLGRLAAP